MSSNLRDWSKTGLLYDLKEDKDRECCSFMLEEAYDYLKNNERELSGSVIDSFLPVVKLIFEMEGKTYENIDHEELSDIISNLTVELDSQNYPFRDTTLTLSSAKRYLNNNG